MRDKGYAVEVRARRPRALKATDAEDDLAGIRIIRCFTTWFDDEKVGGRLLNMLIADLQIFARLLFSRRRAAIVPDTTSIFAGLTAWGLSLIRRSPYVFVATEIYPDAPINMGLISPNGVMARLWRFAARRTVARAARVITICEAEQKRAQRYARPADRAKFRVISNWAEVDKIKPIPRSQNEFRHLKEFQAKLTLVYSGRIGRSHDMETIFQTARLLDDEADIKFVIVGAGKRFDEVKQKAAKLALNNMAFLPYQPRAKLNHLLSVGDLSLVSLIPQIHTIPSRVYPAMAAGQALAAIAARDSGLGQFVDGGDFGFRVDNGAGDELARKLKDLSRNPDELNAMKTAARQAVETRYSREISVAQYVKTIESAL